MKGIENEVENLLTVLFKSNTKNRNFLLYGGSNTTELNEKKKWKFIYGKMKQYRNEMAIIVHRQRIFHCLNNGCVSSWARVLEKYQQAIESDSQFFIASIKTDPFSILITSRIFYSFFFLLLLLLLHLFYVLPFQRQCLYVYIVRGHNVLWVWTGKSAMFSQSPSDIVDLVDFIFFEAKIM